MPGDGIDPKGFDNLDKVFKELAADANISLAAALFASAQDVANKADNLVPVDEGILKASQSITPPRAMSKNPTARITYGGPAAPYAVVQHERLDYDHPKGGQAKYLEEPFLEEVNAWPSRFAGRIKLASRYLR